MIPSGSEVLLESTARVSLAAAALWTGLRLLRVGNARVQKTAWTMVLVAAIAMPLLVGWQWQPAWAAVQLPMASLTRWTQVHPAEQRTITMPARTIRATRTTQSPERAVAVQDDLAIAASAPADFNVEPSDEYRASEKAMPADVAPAPAPRRSTISTGTILALVVTWGWFLYLAVSAALLMRLLWGLVSTMRLWRQAHPVQVREESEWPAGVALRWSRRIASPVNIGAGILLPANYPEWDQEKLRVVLAHESSHVRQHDFYLQMAAGVYAAVTWLNPLGWWLKRKLAELGEAISDHAGLEAASSPSAYAKVLLEFAALPRPTVAGVAMAHSTNLHQRIERLLNETSFRRTCGVHRRALAALVVPVLVIGAAALVRVQAATSQTNVPRDAKPEADALLAQARVIRQSKPAAEQVADAAVAQAAAASPEPAPAPAPTPAPEETLQEPPMPPVMPVPVVPVVPSVPPVAAVGPIEGMHFGPGAFRWEGRGGVYEFDDFDGDPYAIVGDPGTKTRFSGDWDDDRGKLVEKARAIAHGHFLLFEHDGKYYVVDDPAIVSQIESSEKAMEDQREQMRALSKQMHEQAEQAREEARRARAIAVEKIPVPDIAKEMADLNAAVAVLKADQGGTVSREQLAEIQRKLSEVQRRLMTAEIKVNVDLNLNSAMKQMWADEGKIGGQMGKIGGEMGRVARENNSKVRSMIDESLKNGKAKPVN